MKKTFIALSLLGTFLANNVLAQDFPVGDPQVKFEVVNVSQDNQNAESVGARPGDVLRYSLTAFSQSENAENFSPKIDISQILVTTELIDTGIGEVSESKELIFPAFSQAAPYERNFTFFSRVKPDCGNFGELSVSAHGKVTLVKLNCGLTTTGPGTEMVIFLVLLTIGVFALFLCSHRKE